MNQFPKEAGVYKRSYSKEEEKHYTIYTPENLSDGKEPSLIILLHWGGPVYPYKGEEILSGLGIPALGDSGAIIAAPDCPSSSGHWNNPESEDYVLNLQKLLIENYEIKRGKTILVGYSRGGIGTWFIGGRNQDSFAGVLIVSARPPEELASKDWKIPLYVIHSTNDEVFPFEETAKAVHSLKEKGVSVVFRKVEGIAHYNTGAFIGYVREAVPWIGRVLRKS